MYIYYIIYWDIIAYENEIFFTQPSMKNVKNKINLNQSNNIKQKNSCI